MTSDTNPSPLGPFHGCTAALLGEALELELNASTSSFSTLMFCL